MNTHTPDTRNHAKRPVQEERRVGADARLLVSHHAGASLLDGDVVGAHLLAAELERKKISQHRNSTAGQHIASGK